MGIFLGLVGALFYGTSDFFARFATREVGTYRTLWLMQFYGGIALGVYLVFSGTLARLSGTTVPEDWFWAVVVGLLNLVSSLALYRSFEVGIITIVSPIVASYAAFTLLLSLLSGETENMTELQLMGVIITIIGIVLASYHPLPAPVENAPAPRRGLPRGVPHALFASVGYGVTFWLLGVRVTPELGGIAPVWICRLVTITVLALLARPMGQSLKVPRGRVWLFITACGVLDTVAFVASALGLETDQVAIVTLMTSLFSAFTVLLAWLFLKEQIARIQWLGIALIFLGVILVSI